MPKTSESKVLLIAIAGTFMVILDQTIMNTALPHIIAVFNETTDRAQLIISAYLMATAITTPCAAFLAERYGIKKVYIFSQIGFLAGSVLCGIAWDANSLIAFRIIQGLAGGLVSPLSMTFLYLTVPPEDRGTAMGIFGIPMMLAPAIGPLIGGYLVDYWSWRMVFYINVPVVLAAVALGYAWIEDSPTSNVSFDYKGFALASIGFSCILYAFSYAPTWHWSDWRIQTLLTVGIIGVFLWIIVELREKKPLLDLHMFKIGGYALGIGLTFVTTIGLFSLIFLLPLFLQTLRGLRAFDSGLMTLPQAVGSMITMPLAGWIYDKIGPRMPSVVGLILTGLCSMWLGILDVTTPDETLRWILFFRGAGMGLSMMPIMTYALSSVPQRMTAQASSLINVARTLFGSLGIAVFATLLDSFTKTNLALMVQTVTPDSAIALRLISQIQVYLQQFGYPLDVARNEAIVLLYEFIYQRAGVMAFEMNYVIGSIIVLLGVIPAMFLPFGRFKKQAVAVEM
jgi:EmrB/QacA subfamily drug resistance transporter